MAERYAVGDAGGFELGERVGERGACAAHVSEHVDVVGEVGGHVGEEVAEEARVTLDRAEDSDVDGVGVGGGLCDELHSRAAGDVEFEGEGGAFGGWAHGGEHDFAESVELGGVAVGVFAAVFGEWRERWDEDGVGVAVLQFECDAAGDDGAVIDVDGGVGAGGAHLEGGFVVSDLGAEHHAGEDFDRLAVVFAEPGLGERLGDVGAVADGVAAGRERGCEGERGGKDGALTRAAQASIRAPAWCGRALGVTEDGHGGAGRGRNDIRTSRNRSGDTTTLRNPSRLAFAGHASPLGSR